MIELKNINPNESGLSVRGKLNNMFTSLITGVMRSLCKFRTSNSSFHRKSKMRSSLLCFMAHVMAMVVVATTAADADVAAASNV